MLKRWLNLRTRKSVFISLLISNILILILPLVIGTVLYKNVESLLLRNVQKSNDTMLEQLRQTIDGLLVEVDRLSQQIVFNPKLEFLLNADRIALSDNYRYLEFVHEYLNLYRTFSSRFIYDFYLYFDRVDTILKPNVMTDSETFYDKYYRYKDMDYEAWRTQVLKSYHNYDYLPSRILLRDGGIEQPSFGDRLPLDVVTFVQSLPFRDVSGIRGSLVVLIDESYMRQMIRQIGSVHESAVFVVGKDNSLLMGTTERMTPELGLLEAMDREAGILQRTMDGVPMMVSYTKSKESGWKYILIMPRNLFLQHVQQTKSLALGLFVLFLAGGVVSAYLMAYRNYRPVERMVTAILKSKRLSAPQSSNEYEFIRSTLEESIAEETQLRDRLTQQAPVIRASFLLRLIRGYVDVSDDSHSSLEFMGIAFTGGYFMLTQVQVDDASRFTSDRSEKQWTLIRFILSNIGSDFLHKHGLRGYTVDMARNRVAMLLNLDTGDESELANLRAMHQALKALIEERFKLSITLAVSGIHRGMGEIGKCYLESLNALDYKLIRGQSSILYFQDIQDRAPHYYFPIDVEIQLMNHVKNGDARAVGQLLDNIYAINFKSNSITPELGKCLFFNISGTLLKIVNAANLSYRDVFGGEFDSVGRILSRETAEEMQDTAKSMFAQLCEYIGNARAGSCDPLLKEITAIIDRRFADNSLGLTAIAEQVGMTPQYISTYFKKASGQNMTDYIAKVRIERAKRLMEDKTLTNVQIAQMVGYTNDIVFIRAFKKLEGVTPGRYRELAQ